MKIFNYFERSGAEKFISRFIFTPGPNMYLLYRLNFYKRCIQKDAPSGKIFTSFAIKTMDRWSHSIFARVAH